MSDEGGGELFSLQQERINQAHQKLKEWKTHNDQEKGEGHSETEDQDKQSQEFDEIHLEMVDMKNQSTLNDDEKIRSSVRSKASVTEHYKQFYGGEDDIVQVVNPLQQVNKRNDGTMGAFQGVYLPCVTNILSVVIFLRISFIIGEAGIFQAFAILFFSTTTTFLTILSMSAIATNGKIRTGGVYYMISRSLGPSSGGAIGILYYLAITFSSAISILGAIEAIHVVTQWSLGPLAFSMRFFSFIMLGVLLSVNIVGNRFVNRIGVVIIGLVFLSILSVIIGFFASKARSEELQSRVPGLTGIDGQNFRDNWSSNYRESSFYQLHAMFFNACTGILQGANSSANLRDPIKAIPKGTISAHLSTLTLYILLFILFGSVGNREALTDLNVIVSAEVAWPQRWIVYIGIILSSSGSALQQIKSSPLIIHAIASDDMLPKIFNFLKGDIRKSFYFTAGLIAISICFGSIDQVSPLVTIFFLLCYGGVNIACFLLDLLGSPNWRPKWKYYHKATAFFGVLFCVASMLVISWWASLISIVGAIIIYVYLDRKSQGKNWGDGIEGMRAERARNALLKIDKYKKHVKNWRPHYLALGYINEKGKISSPGIFKLLHQLRKGTGLAIYGCVIKGDYTTQAYEEATKKEIELDNFMKKNKYNVFSKVIVSQNIENGMVYLIQSSGLGGLEPNTILLSWPNQWEDDQLKSQRFVNLIVHTQTVGHLLTVLKPQKEFDNDIKHQGTIDIWSFNFEKGMLLLIAQILLNNSHWKRCTCRLFIITSLPEAESDTMKRVAREFLNRYRLLSENIFIEVVHVEPAMIEQFTYTLNQTLKNKEKEFQKAMQEGSKDFQYGTLPSLMKIKALQEKEIKSALELRMQRGSLNGRDQDFDEKIENAKKINQIILNRSKEASLVITNLPPVIQGQPAQEYLSFCQAMTENIQRLLFIQNSSKEVLTQYN